MNVGEDGVCKISVKACLVCFCCIIILSGSYSKLVEELGFFKIFSNIWNVTVIICFQNIYNISKVAVILFECSRPACLRHAMDIKSFIYLLFIIFG